MGAIRAGQGRLPACAVDQDRSSGGGTFPPCPAPRQPASRACTGGKGPVNRVLQGSRLLLGTTDAQQFPACTQRLAGSGALESGSSIPAQVHLPAALGRPQEGDHRPRWVVTTAGRVGGLQPSLSPLPPSLRPVGFPPVPREEHGAAGMPLPGSPPSAGSAPAT